MINLLPEQEKRDIVKEYQRRRWVVAGVLTAAAILIAVILLFPAYVLSWYQERIAEASTSSVMHPSAQNDAGLAGQLGSLKKTMAALNPGNTIPKTNPTKLIAKIIADKTADNRISGFNVSIVDSTITVEVTGTAKTRTSLQSFITALKKESSIQTVDFPISDLAQDSGAAFDITITASS